MNDGNDKQICLLHQFTSHFSSIEFELHSSYMQCHSIFSFEWNLIFHFYIISSPLIICSIVEPKLMMGECLILLVLQKFIIFFVLKKKKWNAFPQMVNMTHLLLLLWVLFLKNLITKYHNKCKEGFCIIYIWSPTWQFFSYKLFFRIITCGN
jgi:hypothetical protein